MRARLLLASAIALCATWSAQFGICEDVPAVALPEGVKAVWDLGLAYRETTPTRERVCINGLWRWQPADRKTNQPPTGNWGYFEVPGCWPGITDYMQKDSQTVYVHPSWKSQRLAGVTAAWYEREITIPQAWNGRRIALATEYLNSDAAVYIDGKRTGEMQFPRGEVDLTAACRPGGEHVLSLLVAAVSRRELAQLSYDNPTGRTTSSVARRGLCGDVYLTGAPAGPRIADVKVETSVRKGEIAVNAALQELAADGRYALRAVITEKGNRVAEFTGQPFSAAALKEGRIAATEKWKPKKLWDLHTPQNMFEVAVSLLGDDGRVLDAALPVRFGFREFWIDGRDFYLNGSRIFLSALPLDNAQVGASAATYAAAKETMSRLRATGINTVYTHNYSCEPGAHLSFAEILRAADDVGMLVSLSQPHFSRYDWKAPDAEQHNGYARLAEFYVRVAQNHPAVVFYAMSHNATGYYGDMDPDLIDGIANPRTPGGQNNANSARRAEAIVRRLDPTRVVYHHHSGNLGAMYTCNFYPNFVPIQEMSDWFEHWATKGVVPAFTCEFAAPFTWDWSMYRGLYQGKREWGGASVPWEYCNAEWNAQFVGDKAYQLLEAEKINLRWEAEKFQAGAVWHRWDYPFALGSDQFVDEYPVFARYLADNWRALRTWGLSANSPWVYDHLWTLHKGVDKRRKQLQVDWQNLQRPGFSPDYLGEQYEHMATAFERSDWTATVAAQALVRNNLPLLMYIGGAPAAFTSKDHNFKAGETVEKQLILINNCRETVSCECRWSWRLPKAIGGTKMVSLPTGEQERIPLRVELPAGLPPGTYELTAAVKFSNGESQTDIFTLHVLPPAPAVKPAARIALWDPAGETGKLLDGLGVKFQPVAAGADLSGYDLLIVGKAAFRPDGPGPDVGRVRDGLKVIVFEQGSQVLEKRFGFRVEEYGLRNVFKRVPDHAALAGLDLENLRDWRGDATILPPRSKFENLRGAGVVRWCDIPVPRLWRCGNRGNVASVLIEKPACGNFLPIVDGGFSLQYSPLLEYREGKGMVLFCQMDVTGRTESDPAAERLARNIINYVSAWQPAPTRQALYVGDPAGKSHLQKGGVSAASYEGGRLSVDQVLIVGPGGGRQLSAHAAAVGQWLAAGGHLLGIGLDQADVNPLLPGVAMTTAEHIAACFEPFGAASPLAGVGPADVHNRAPKEFALITGGAKIVGDGVLATAEDGHVVLCQLVPWQCDYSKEQHNVKQTFRRASFLVTRLLGNLGVEGTTAVLARFSSPVDPTKAERRWLEGLYLDQPEEWDDPYRFFRW